MSNLDENELPDAVPNSKLQFNEINDFGIVLRKLRLNQGYSLNKLGKMINRSPQSVANIENSRAGLPAEHKLREWLVALGCKENLPFLMDKSKDFYLEHAIHLQKGEECNPDIIRLLKAYRLGKISQLDRDLLKLIARKDI